MLPQLAQGMTAARAIVIMTPFVESSRCGQTAASSSNLKSWRKSCEASCESLILSPLFTAQDKQTLALNRGSRQQDEESDSERNGAKLS